MDEDGFLLLFFFFLLFRDSGMFEDVSVVSFFFFSYRDIKKKGRMQVSGIPSTLFISRGHARN